MAASVSSQDSQESGTDSKQPFKLTTCTYYLLLGIATGAVISLGTLAIYIASWRNPLCEPLKDTERCLPSSDPFIGVLASKCRNIDALTDCSSEQANTLRNRLLLHSYVPSLLSGSLFAIALSTYLTQRYLKKIYFRPLPKDYVWISAQWLLSLVLTALLSSFYFIAYTLITAGESACSLMVPNYKNLTLPCHPLSGIQKFCDLPDATNICNFHDQQALSLQFAISSVLPSVITGGFMGVMAGLYYYFQIKKAEPVKPEGRGRVAIINALTPKEGFATTAEIIAHYNKKPDIRKLAKATRAQLLMDNQFIAKNRRAPDSTFPDRTRSATPLATSRADTSVKTMISRGYSAAR